MKKKHIYVVSEESGCFSDVRHAFKKEDDAAKYCKKQREKHKTEFSYEKVEIR
jgi:hypothetical protein